jgi:hypothetical protein
VRWKSVNKAEAEDWLSSGEHRGQQMERSEAKIPPGARKVLHYSGNRFAYKAAGIFRLRN